jgi:hypothetical protein
MFMDTKPAQRKYLAGLKQGEKMGKGHSGVVAGTTETGHGPGRSNVTSPMKVNGGKKGSK